MRRITGVLEEPDQSMTRRAVRSFEARFMQPDRVEPRTYRSIPSPRSAICDASRSALEGRVDFARAPFCSAAMVILRWPRRSAFGLAVRVRSPAPTPGSFPTIQIGPDQAVDFPTRAVASCRGEPVNAGIRAEISPRKEPPMKVREIMSREVEVC
jgi:hypothetical protein